MIDTECTNRFHAFVPRRIHPEVIKFLSRIGRKTKGKKAPKRKHLEPGYYANIALLRWAMRRLEGSIESSQTSCRPHVVEITTNDAKILLNHLKAGHPAKNEIPPSTNRAST